MHLRRPGLQRQLGARLAACALAELLQQAPQQQAGWHLHLTAELQEVHPLAVPARTGLGRADAGTTAGLGAVHELPGMVPDRSWAAPDMAAQGVAINQKHKQPTFCGVRDVRMGCAHALRPVLACNAAGAACSASIEAGRVGDWAPGGHNSQFPFHVPAVPDTLLHQLLEDTLQHT